MLLIAYCLIVSLLDAKPIDTARERRRKIIIAALILIIIGLAITAWEVRFWPEQRVVNHFFAALESQNFERAYGVWMADPNWKQHPEKYSRYSYNDFYKDWGPGGEWGPTRSYKVENAESSGGSGVVVNVEVNHRVERARVWVEKSDKSLSFPP